MSRANRISIVAAIILLSLCGATEAAEPGGVAVVRVVTIPEISPGSFQFAGSPAGEARLSVEGSATLRASLGSGRHQSTLERIDPALRSAGYALTAITCDDGSSGRRSRGDLSRSAAFFELENGETVTCTFVLRLDSVACTCPKEGRWNVVNHIGSMACTGVVSMTHPLTASSSRGTLKVGDDCKTIVASGMSDSEADIEMYRQPDCGFVGTVGGARDGIPMTIEFRWSVENPKRITGDLRSTVSQQGMTCRMNRTYQLDYDG